jgi:hypothetical protein
MTKREKQDTARNILVQMAKLARTPVSLLAEFISGHDISGLSVGQTHGLTQAARDRIHEAFRASAFLKVAQRKAPACSMTGS